MTVWRWVSYLSSGPLSRVRIVEEMHSQRDGGWGSRWSQQITQVEMCRRQPCPHMDGVYMECERLIFCLLLCFILFNPPLLPNLPQHLLRPQSTFVLAPLQGVHQCSRGTSPPPSLVSQGDKWAGGCMPWLGTMQRLVGHMAGQGWVSVRDCLFGGKH